LLGVIVGKEGALSGDAVDVGRASAHHAAMIGADIPDADIVSHDHHDVGLFVGVCAAARPPNASGSAITAVARCFFLIIALSSPWQFRADMAHGCVDRAAHGVRPGR